MPIAVQCACGKHFSVRDEHAGRQGRCPACKATITVPSASSDIGAIALDESAAPAKTRPAPAPAPQPQRQAAPRKVTRFDPNAVKARPQEQSPRFAISPKAILLFALLIIIPTGLWLVKIGPVASFDAYQKLEPKIEMWTTDTLNAVFNEEYKGISFNEFIRPPKVTNVMIDSPIMMIKLPAEVFVQGQTTDGSFKGRYFTKTQRIELEMGLDQDSRTVTALGHIEADRLVLDSYK